MSNGRSSSFLTIPETATAAAEEEEDDEEAALRSRLLPRSSPVPRKRGMSVFDETADYLRTRQPSLSRRVSFADAAGQELVEVRRFARFDSDEDGGSGGGGEEDEEEGDEGRPAAPSCRVCPAFSCPAASELLEALRARKVEVESVSAVEDEPLALRGVVRVLNVSYHKSVYVRCTMDGWKTFFDHVADYAPGSCDGETDRFSFQLAFAAPFLFDGARLEFVVRYETPAGVYWANNQGVNYAAELRVSETGASPEPGRGAGERRPRGILKAPSRRSRWRGRGESSRYERMRRLQVQGSSCTLLCFEHAGGRPSAYEMPDFEDTVSNDFSTKPSLETAIIPASRSAGDESPRRAVSEADVLRPVPVHPQIDIELTDTGLSWGWTCQSALHRSAHTAAPATGLWDGAHGNEGKPTRAPSLQLWTQSDSWVWRSQCQDSPVLHCSQYTEVTKSKPSLSPEFSIDPHSAFTEVTPSLKSPQLPSAPACGENWVSSESPEIPLPPHTVIALAVTVTPTAQTPRNPEGRLERDPWSPCAVKELTASLGVAGQPVQDVLSQAMGETGVTHPKPAVMSPHADPAKSPLLANPEMTPHIPVDPKSEATGEGQEGRFQGKAPDPRGLPLEQELGLVAEILEASRGERSRGRAAQPQSAGEEGQRAPRCPLLDSGCGAAWEDGGRPAGESLHARGEEVPGVLPSCPWHPPGVTRPGPTGEQHAGLAEPATGLPSALTPHLPGANTARVPEEHAGAAGLGDPTGGSPGLAACPLSVERARQQVGPLAEALTDALPRGQQGHQRMAESADQELHGDGETEEPAARPGTGPVARGTEQSAPQWRLVPPHTESQERLNQAFIQSLSVLGLAACLAIGLNNPTIFLFIAMYLLSLCF
ncbi:PPR3A phosphatase, partial [Atractosteus spatula]|nr:PPR3A phosphatase [Atractosteus spatula]